MNYKEQDFIVTREDRLLLEELLSDETIFSLANGTLGTRGHFIEGYGTSDDPITLMNGFYNQYPFRYEENYEGFPQLGQTIVNLPDGSYIQIETEDGMIDLSNMKLISIKRSLNMLRGISYRKVRYESSKGYLFDLIEEKMVTTNHHMIVTKLSIKSPNYEGILKLNSYLRLPAIRYIENTDPRLPNTRKHLELIDIENDKNYGVIYAKTTNTSLYINSAISHDIEFEYRIDEEQIKGYYEVNLKKNETFELTKYQLYTSSLTNEMYNDDIKLINDYRKPFDEYKKSEEKARKSFWDKTHIEISNPEIEQALRYNLYQLNQSASTNHHMHIAAKGISGEGYEGHYFWDTEVYMLPFFILTDPNKAKELLLYRYHKLDESRLEARQLGFDRGAKIPWRTINGREASPYFLAGSAQVHINSDISLAIINYYHATHDLDFMFDYGLEIILETALFLLAYGHFKNDEFHIFNVTGPDEYTVLVNDNYYTNKAAKEHFKFASDFTQKHMDKVKPLLDKIGFTDIDMNDLKRAADNIVLLKDDKLNLVKQDASFLDKKDIDLNTLDQEKFPLLLYYHPLFLYQHQIIKQADALLALVLFNDVDQETFKNSYDYYIKRTTHDSSLSKCIYGIAAYQIGLDDLGYEYFKKVAELDFRDNHNRTQHGLHVANLGGSYLMLMYGIFGLRFKETLSIHPIDQKHIKHLQTRFMYHGVTIDISINSGILDLQVDKPLMISIFNKRIHVKQSYQVNIRSF